MINSGTSADKLLSYLSSTENVRYVALYDNLTSQNLHTVRRRRRTRGQNRIIIEGVMRNYNSTMSKFSVNNEDMNGLLIQEELENKVELLHE